MPTAIDKSSWTGQQIDERLPLLEWLGKTDSGDVFRTQVNSAQAAILLAASDAPGADEQFAEWNRTIELHHPHLLRAFECGRARIEDCDFQYLLLEMPEEALAQILPERALSPQEVRQMLRPTLDALEYLHGRGLVHGGIQPAGILVVGEQLKLALDTVHPAGFARSRESSARIYDAPETDSGIAGEAADVWALGVTIVEAMTQQPPRWVRSSRRDPLIPVTVPQPFAEIARRCLRCNPAVRCTLAEIAELLNGAAAPAQTEPSPAHRPAIQQAPVQADSFAPEEPQPDQASEPLPFRTRLRSVEEDDAPQRFPARMVLAIAAFLFLLIAGFVAYAHKSKPAASAPESGAAHKPADDGTTIKPLPHPSGPTVKGEVAQRVIPEIPERTSRAIRGAVEVKIKVVVDHDGGVMNTSIESPGKSRYFANQAQLAANKWTFRPAKIHGVPASSVWQLRFEFTKNGTRVTPVEVTP